MCEFLTRLLDLFIGLIPVIVAAFGTAYFMHFFTTKRERRNKLNEFKDTFIVPLMTLCQQCSAFHEALDKESKKRKSKMEIDSKSLHEQYVDTIFDIGERLYNLTHYQGYFTRIVAKKTECSSKKAEYIEYLRFLTLFCVRLKRLDKKDFDKYILSSDMISRIRRVEEILGKEIEFVPPY